MLTLGRQGGCLGKSYRLADDWALGDLLVIILFLGTGKRAALNHGVGRQLMSRDHGVSRGAW